MVSLSNALYVGKSASCVEPWDATTLRLRYVQLIAGSQQSAAVISDAKASHDERISL